jgi:hypothetical protein
MKNVFSYLIYNELEDVYEQYNSEELLECGKMYVNDDRGLFRVVELDNVITI